MQPTILLLVALGGAAGALSRHHLASALYRRLGTRFPWGTLAVNLSGSLALGVLLPFLGPAAEEVRLGALLAVGFLGAFTTFGTLAYEAVILSRQGERGRAVATIAANLVLGLVAVAAGLAVGIRASG